MLPFSANSGNGQTTVTPHKIPPSNILITSVVASTDLVDEAVVDSLAQVVVQMLLHYP